jgi:hypothetical protein
MRELIFRFLIGGVVVSVFATMGDILRPKSFGGLFGAARWNVPARVAAIAQFRPSQKFLLRGGNNLCATQFGYVQDFWRSTKCRL